MFGRLEFCQSMVDETVSSILRYTEEMEGNIEG